MFIGHFGVGFGAKTLTPKTSLGTLFIAAQFVDLLWPTLLLLGFETVAIKPGITKLTPLDFTSYPISHSLLMVCVWGLVIGGLYWFIKRNMKGAIVLGMCVVSHWLLDLFVHRPDLPLYPGDASRYGLGLWNSPVVAVVLEGLIFIGGMVFYLRTTTARNRAGTYGFWLLVGMLVLIYLANIFGPPPPSVHAIAWAGQLQWLFVLMAYWVDRNRDISRQIT